MLVELGLDRRAAAHRAARRPSTRTRSTSPTSATSRCSSRSRRAPTLASRDPDRQPGLDTRRRSTRSSATTASSSRRARRSSPRRARAPTAPGLFNCPHTGVALAATREARDARRDPEERPRGRDLDRARAQVRRLQGAVPRDALDGHRLAAARTRRSSCRPTTSVVRDRMLREIERRFGKLSALCSPASSRRSARCAALEPRGRRGAARDRGAARSRTGVRIGDSIAVNGACLTVTSIAGGGGSHFDAVRETLDAHRARRSARGRAREPRARDARRRAPRRPHRAGPRRRHGPRARARAATATTCGSSSRCDAEFADATWSPKGSVAIDGVSLTVVGVAAERLRRRADPAHARRDDARRARARRAREPRGATCSASTCVRYLERTRGVKSCPGRADVCRSGAGSERRRADQDANRRTAVCRARASPTAAPSLRDEHPARRYGVWRTRGEGCFCGVRGIPRSERSADGCRCGVLPSRTIAVGHLDRERRTHGLAVTSEVRRAA